MARVYTASFDQVAFSAAQDAFAIIATTTPKAVRLLRCVMNSTDVTINPSQMIAVQILLFTGATITAGTGGSSATISKVDPGDAAASGFTVTVNNVTTQASTTGSSNTVYDNAFHSYNGMDESFAVDGSNPRVANPIMVQAAANAGSILVRLKNAPTGTIHLSGTVWVEEAG